MRVRVGAWRVCDCLCGCGVVSGARGVVLCAGRVDKWERERREPVWLVPSSLFFCFVERMTGVDPAAFTVVWWRSAC